MIGFNGGLIGGLADARETTLLSAKGVWTLAEQRNAKLANLWPVVLTGVAATGGTVTDITDGGVSYRVHTFTSSGSFVVTAGGSVQYLVIGAGGGSGGEYSGAGGAGGAGHTPLSGHGLSSGQCSTGFACGLHGIPFGSGGRSIFLHLISKTIVELAGIPTRAAAP